MELNKRARQILAKWVEELEGFSDQLLRISPYLSSQEDLECLRNAIKKAAIEEVNVSESLLIYVECHANHVSYLDSGAEGVDELLEDSDYLVHEIPNYYSFGDIRFKKPRSLL